MFCKYCGKELLDQAVLCPYCGMMVKNIVLPTQPNKPVVPVPQENVQPAPQENAQPTQPIGSEKPAVPQQLIPQQIIPQQPVAQPMVSVVREQPENQENCCKHGQCEKDKAKTRLSMIFGIVSFAVTSLVVLIVFGTLMDYFRWYVGGRITEYPSDIDGGFAFAMLLGLVALGMGIASMTCGLKQKRPGVKFVSIIVFIISILAFLIPIVGIG